MNGRLKERERKKLVKTYMPNDEKEGKRIAGKVSYVFHSGNTIPSILFLGQGYTDFHRASSPKITRKVKAGDSSGNSGEVAEVIPAERNIKKAAEVSLQSEKRVPHCEALVFTLHNVIL